MKNIRKIDIEHAIDKTKTGQDAAAFIGVSYPTYKKYAEQYGLFEEQKQKGLSQRGRRTNKDNDHFYFNPHKAINGHYDGTRPVRLHTIKKKYIFEGFKTESCDKCGYDEKNEESGCVPLICIFKDGHRLQYGLDDIMFVCINCLYVMDRRVVYQVGTSEGSKGRQSLLNQIEGDYQSNRRYDEGKKIPAEKDNSAHMQDRITSKNV